MRIGGAGNEVLALTFDLDDTLYDNRPVIESADRWYSSMLEFHPWLRKIRASEMIPLLKDEIRREDPLLESDVTLFRTEVLRRLFVSCGTDPAAAVTEAALLVRRFIQVRSSFMVPKSSFRILHLLGRKYPMIALTNGNVDAERIGLASCFSCCIRADRRLPAKPDPALFLEASRLLGVPPGNILHVGDDPVTDIYGACRAGFMTCMIRTEAFHDKIKPLPDLEISGPEELESILL
jgi:putative hydrolase of the HAD superfamily